MKKLRKVLPKSLRNALSFYFEFLVSPKQAFLDIAKFYTDSRNIKMITLKLFDTYGPNDNRRKLFNLLKNAALKNKPLAMSFGEQLIDIVYIDDVINAFILASKRILTIRDVEEFIVSSGKTISLKKLVEIYNEIAPKKVLVKWGALPYRKREVMIPYNKGKNLPRFVPRITFKEGLKKLFKRS